MEPNVIAFLTCESARIDADDRAYLHGVFGVVAVSSVPAAADLTVYIRASGIFGPSHWSIDVEPAGETGGEGGRIDVADLLMSAYDRAHHFTAQAVGVFDRFGRYDLRLHLNGACVATAPLWIQPLDP